MPPKKKASTKKVPYSQQIVDMNGNKTTKDNPRWLTKNQYYLRQLVDMRTGARTTADNPNAVTRAWYRDHKLVDKYTGKRTTADNPNAVTSKWRRNNQLVDMRTGAKTTADNPNAVTRLWYHNHKLVDNETRKLTTGANPNARKVTWKRDHEAVHRYTGVPVAENDLYKTTAAAYRMKTGRKNFVTDDELLAILLAPEFMGKPWMDIVNEINTYKKISLEEVKTRAAYLGEIGIITNTRIIEREDGKQEIFKKPKPKKKICKKDDVNPFQREQFSPDQQTDVPENLQYSRLQTQVRGSIGHPVSQPEYNLIQGNSQFQDNYRFQQSQTSAEFASSQEPHVGKTSNQTHIGYNRIPAQDLITKGSIFNLHSLQESRGSYGYAGNYFYPSMFNEQQASFINRSPYHSGSDVFARSHSLTPESSAFLFNKNVQPLPPIYDLTPKSSVPSMFKERNHPSPLQNSPSSSIGLFGSKQTIPFKQPEVQAEGSSSRKVSIEMIDTPGVMSSYWYNLFNARSSSIRNEKSSSIFSEKNGDDLSFA